jgi:RHS repeat-associated protein
MQFAIGKNTSETAYWNHQAYTIQQKNFNIFGESTGETVTIPSATEGIPLGTSYSFNHSYTTTNGLPFKDTYPQAGGLPSETVTHTYATDLDLPDTLGSNLAGYQTGTDYDAWGDVTQSTLGVTPDQAVVTNDFDLTLGRLNETKVTRSTGTPATVDDEKYGYDPAGNLIKQVSSRLESAATSETQCFGYNSLEQLATAWTATDDCKVTPTAADSGMVGDNLGAASAYWTSWTIDAQGDRTGQTVNAFAGGPAGATTTTYRYDGNGAGQPHTLTSTATTGGSTTSYAYDRAGNMIRRNAGQGDQTLTYDDAGELTQITGGTAGTTSYRYDAGGNVLLQQDPTSTVLYLPGEQITLTGSSTAAGVRYISLPGGQTVVRTGNAADAFSFELADRHGTPSVYLDSTGQTPTWRQFTPYGEARGASAAVPDNRGFLNKTVDTSTGLTSVGAREYDASSGRFITIDPDFESADPGLLNGYSYTGNNPIGQTDPTGMDSCATGGQGCVWYGKCKCYAPPGGSGWKNPPTQVGDDSDSSTAPDNTSSHPLKKKVVLTKAQKKFIQNSGRQPILIDPDHLTVGDLLAWAMQSRPLWRWTCTQVFHASGQVCQEVPGVKPLKAGDWAWDGAIEIANTGAMAISGLALLATCPETDGATCAAAGGTEAAISKVTQSLEEEGEPETVAAAFEDLVASDSDTALAAVCGDSFDPKTEVLLADGKKEPIGAVKVGDRVKATDPVTKKTRSEPVTALHHNLDQHMADVTVSAGGRETVLHTTANHLFWDATAGKWTVAGRLARGDHLASPTGGTDATVTRVYRFDAPQEMDNLTVDVLHTYYVLADDAAILVHNAPKVGLCPVSGASHGELGEMASLDRMQTDGYTDIIPQVQFMTRDGVVFRADFIARNPQGKVVAIESKVNSGGLTENQEEGYPELTKGVAYVYTSKLEEDYGWKIGQGVTMPLEIDHWICPVCTP